MKSLLIFILFICFSYSNDTIKVYLGDNITTMGKIEVQIIKNVFKLYNQSRTEKIEYKIVNLRSFEALFNFLENADTKNKDHLISVNQITITQERLKKYDFSTPYTPSKIAFISRDNKEFDYEKYNRIGVLKNSIQYDHLDENFDIKKIKKVVYSKVNELNIALKNEELDFIYAENVHAWDFPEFIVSYIPENQPGEGYGFLYLKGSKLKSELDKFIKYYLSSIKFKRLLMNFYTTEVIEYYMKALK